MTLIKLGYSPKNNRYKWKQLPLDFIEKEYNGKLVIKFHEKLWELLKVIVKMKSKGWDSIILIDGRRRSGKSTLMMQIAYLLDPNITIDNYVAGLEESPEKIAKAKDCSPLLFDEGSLVASSKDVMSKKSKQLHKIIDVIGQKRLTLIFCMPSMLSMSRSIVVDHAMFLIRVGVEKKTLRRGKFKVYKNKRMKQLYDIGKKDPRLMKKVKKSFDGKFEDFHLPFEDEYFKLKNTSMNEALNPDIYKKKSLTESEIKTNLMLAFKQNNPDIPITIISKGFGFSKDEYYRRQRVFKRTHGGKNEG